MIKYYTTFVILNFLDLIGSYFLLGPDHEFNPICAYIWKTCGFEVLILFKALLTIFPITVIDYYHIFEPKRAKYAMILANVLVSLPVVLLGYLWSIL